MTDAIFEQLDFEVEEAEEDPTVLRLSLDAKAVVKIGPFSRRVKAERTPKAVTMIFILRRPSPLTESFYQNSMRCFYIWQPPK